MENQSTVPAAERPKQFKRTTINGSSLVSHLEYTNGKLYVTFKKNGKVYSYVMGAAQAWGIMEAPSIGKAVLAMSKEITGVLVPQDEEENPW